jgi:hypothetical protein
MSRKINYWALMWGFPILGVVFALLAVLMAVKGWAGVVIWCLAASVFFFWCRFRYPARVRKLFDQQAKNFAGTMTLNSAGMRFERTDGAANTDYTWTAFDSWIDEPGMFLLLMGPTMFIRIPKDKLTTAEQAEVRGWLSSSKLLS